MNKLLPLVLVVIVGSFATSALADEAQSAKGAVVAAGSYQTSDADGASYSVSFVDDALNAPGNDGSIPLIHVRPPGARATLIRPRLQFIEELRKTVENL